jgi:hypothetical protein
LKRPARPSPDVVAHRMGHRMWDRRAHALHDLELITTSWQWPFSLTSKVIGLSGSELKAIRSQWRDPDDDMLDMASRLASLHYWIWALPFWPASPADFWRRLIGFPDPIGERVPLELVEEMGAEAIGPITTLVRHWTVR